MLPPVAAVFLYIFFGSREPVGATVRRAVDAGRAAGHVTQSRLARPDMTEAEDERRGTAGLCT